MRAKGRVSTPGLGVALAAALAMSGCAKKLPAPPSAAVCGDPCATLNCPPGTQCLLASGCTPRCEPEYISPTSAR